MTFFPIAEYRPDVAGLNTAYTDEIRNVLPADGSYVPMPSFMPLTAALPAAPLGTFAVRAMSGETAVFAGQADKLYILDNTDMTWRDVSQPDVTYSANREARWSFAVFGNQVIAVNKNDPPQIYSLNGAGHFRPLGGNPPRAGLVKIWGDFVCLMQLADEPNRVHWSGLNDAEWWTPGERNCDYQDFPEGGVVQGTTEATNPFVFLQSAIYRATFVPGSDIVFSFQKIHDKRGAKSPWSIAARGSYAFFADEGGFFQIAPDGSIAPVGFEKVDRTFFTRLNASAISEIHGAIDPFFSRVYWALDYEGRQIFNEMLVYDWELQRWSIVEIRAAGILPIYTAGYTLDGLDRVSKSLDDLPLSLDSKVWQGGAPVLGAFSVDHKLGVFSGEVMEAVVTSPEMGASSGEVQRVSTLYPVVDTDAGLMAVGGRFRRHDREPLRWEKERLPSCNTGRYTCRSRARFHKFRLRVPAGTRWSHIAGFDVTFNSAGVR